MPPKLEPTKARGVYRRSDGRLIVRVTKVDRATGARRDVARLQAIGTTLEQAEAEAVRLRQEAASAPSSSPAVELPTVAAYAKTWCQRKVARQRWRPGSQSERSIRTGIESMVLPILGERRVDEVTMRELQAWVDTVLTLQRSDGKPYSANYILQSWSSLTSILDAASAEYGLPMIRHDQVELPKAPPRGGMDQALMPEELHALLDIVRARFPEWLAIVVLGFASGARLGELMAANVSDLDLTGSVGVWTIARHFGLDDAIVPGTKSGPPRVAYLDPVSTAMLREAVRGRIGLAELAPPKTYEIAVNRAPGNSARRQQMRQFIERLAEAFGRRLTSKVFRQTHTTLARVAGIAGVVVREQVGHQSEDMQDVYTRLPKASRVAAAEQLASVLHLRPAGAAETGDVGSRVGSGRGE